MYNMKPGSLIANKPMYLLCIDFTKINPSKDSKENVLVLTGFFSKLSQDFVTLIQKPLITAKVLVDKWFDITCISSQIHSDKGCSYEIKYFLNCTLCRVLNSQLPIPYIPCRNSRYKYINHTLHNLLKNSTQRVKVILAFICSILSICL